MRAIPVLAALAAALSIAGCDRPDAGPGANQAAAPPAVAEAPANAGEAAPPPPPAIGKAIPAAFLGVYDASLEACGKPSDRRLAVSATALRFHESIGTVREVTDAGAGAIRVEADYEGEGESWRSLRELRLDDGGAKLTVSGDGTSLVRVRCPAGTG